MHRRFLLVFVCTSALTSCSDCKSENKVNLPGEGEVLVTVNQTVIDRYDLDQTLETTLSGGSRARLSGPSERKVLESLVQTRAMALAMEAQLSPEERRALEREVATKREELLVKRYLREHSDPSPVSQSAVTEFYKAHPERFGARPRRFYELIASERPLTIAERARVLSALAEAPKRNDFAAWVGELRAKGLPLTLQSGDADDAKLFTDLSQTLRDMTPLTPARTIVTGDRISLVRVSRMDESPPAPLVQVARQIREELAAEQLKKAVKEAAAKALKNAKVVYKGT